MSAPTKPKKAKSGLAIIALVVASLALVVSIAALGDVVRASQATYPQPTDAPSVENEPLPKGSRPAQQKYAEKYAEFIDRGANAVEKWGRAHLGSGIHHKNVALAYLCAATKPSQAGLYYASALLDTIGTYGIEPNGTRRGDPGKTTQRFCPEWTSWAPR